MSAKGSLKLARDPKFQALFAVRGVSQNVYKMEIDKIIGVNGNKEFTNLVTVMGCNAGAKFDMSKLNFDKIIIASDADVDGLFIRALLMSFFFKLYPEIIQDGRLYIAEPPLYRVEDKANPFVINKEDYVERYVKKVNEHYKIGFDGKDVTDYLDSDSTMKLLSETSSYVDDILAHQRHYKVHGRLLEIIIEEVAICECNKINVQRLMNAIGEEFKEIEFDEKYQVIKGIIDGRYQSIELSETLLRKVDPQVTILKQWNINSDNKLILKDKKVGTEHKLSLLGILKILKKYQPNIVHRFKGLGENDDEDIKTTIMDPNTRSLIKVQSTDIINDMKTFQLLRGTTPQDMLARKNLMRSFKISRDLIDT